MVMADTGAGGGVARAVATARGAGDSRRADVASAVGPEEAVGTVAYAVGLLAAAIAIAVVWAAPQVACGTHPSLFASTFAAVMAIGAVHATAMAAAATGACELITRSTTPTAVARTAA